VKRKIAAILAADAVGYSRLVAEDEEDTLARLASYQAVFSDFVTRFGGRIFNTAGDAILAEFESAVDAVRCAVDIQETLRARNLAYTPSRQMSFRIGITIGDVVERDGDLLGDGVNVAARLESVSPAGGICISRSVHEVVAKKLSVEFSDRGEQHLKNIPDPVHAYTFSSDVKSENRKRASHLASPATLYWGVFAAVVVVLAGIASFMFIGREQSVQSVKPPPTTATKASIPAENEPNVKSADSSSRPAKGTSAPQLSEQDTASSSEGRASSDDEEQPFREPSHLPTSDPLALQAVLKREWRECHEGQQPEQTIKSCTALINYKIYTGSDLASIYVELGRAQRDRARVDEAIEAYSEAIRLVPGARAYNNRGIAYFDKGQLQKAIVDYTEAIRLDPQYGEAFNNRAWTKVKAGRAAIALDDADKAVRLLPGKAYAWDPRAHIHEDLGNKKAAIRDFRKALDLDSGSKGSLSGLKRLGAAP
jgi:class 3 adenylate cyclase